MPREVKIRILDKDVVADLLAYLDELQGDLARAQKHLEDLRAILGQETEA